MQLHAINACRCMYVLQAASLAQRIHHGALPQRGSSSS